jgi:hypothetical protein
MKQHFRVLVRVKKPTTLEPKRYSEFVFSALKGCTVIAATLSASGTLRTDLEVSRSLPSLIPSKSRGNELGLDQYVTAALEHRHSDVDLIQVVATTTPAVSAHIEQLLSRPKPRLA